jgi:hypothetical protein
MEDLRREFRVKWLNLRFKCGDWDVLMCRPALRVTEYVQLSAAVNDLLFHVPLLIIPLLKMRVFDGQFNFR